MTEPADVIATDEFMNAMLESFFEAVSLAVRVEEFNISMDDRRKLFALIVELVGVYMLKVVADYRLRAADLGRAN